MAKESTRIADIIKPEVFSEYLMEPIREKNALFASGIVTYDALLASKLDVGGDHFTYPYWGKLSATALQAPDEDVEGDIAKIGTDKMVVPRIFRTFNARSTAMASILAGANAMDAIKERVTEVWRDGLQDLFVNILKGVIASAAEKVTLDVSKAAGTGIPSGTNILSANDVIDAKALLGDKGSKFKAIILHSRVRAEFEKVNLISTVQPLGEPQSHEVFMGMQVIEDDRVPTELVFPTAPVDPANPTAPELASRFITYTTFLVREDGFRYGDSDKGFKPVYIKDQPELGMGVETLYTKKMLAFHPLGITWNGASNGVNADKILDTDFANGANWSYKYNPQYSGFVAIKSNQPSA